MVANPQVRIPPSVMLPQRLTLLLTQHLMAMPAVRESRSTTPRPVVVRTLFPCAERIAKTHAQRSSPTAPATAKPPSTVRVVPAPRRSSTWALASPWPTLHQTRAASTRWTPMSMPPGIPSGSGTALPACATDTLSTGVGPQCAMANSWRFETACTDGQLMVELPSRDVFHGYYHVESGAYPNSARHLVSQDVHCSRDLYLVTGLASPPAAISDGGVDAARSDSPPAAFCQLSDGRHIPAGAAYGASDRCNCCVCTSSGQAVCQAAGCSDASFAKPASCQSDQDCNQGRGVCAFEPGCDSPRGTCMADGACPLFAVSDMAPWEYCGCDGVTYPIVNSSTSPQQYAYKPYSHYGACP